MKVNNLYISEYVISEVGQSVGSLGSHHPDATDKRTVHHSLYKAEDVLNAASVLGLDAVVLLLLVNQRVVAKHHTANELNYRMSLLSFLFVFIILLIPLSKSSEAVSQTSAGLESEVALEGCRVCIGHGNIARLHGDKLFV